MELGGYANRIAHVDLTAGAVEYKGIPEEWARKYIGARGLGVKYVFENDPTVDPLSPDNILCFMNGPLTGTAANMSGRMAIVTKSPLTGTVTDSHQGGWSAARMRWAGFDGLIFKGKSETPVYAYCEDGNVELRDASELWGKGIHSTIRHFQNKYGKKDLTVIAIGQASENLVKYGCWINEDDRASGRGGTGTVGGSKLLKAVVIKAKKISIPAKHPEAWKSARRRALATIMDEKNITSPRKGGLSVYGTNVLMNITNTIGALPALNSRQTAFEGAELLAGEYVNEHILVNDPTCHACPVACKKEVKITEGEFSGLQMESVEYEPAWALGANCGNTDINSVAKMIDMSNDYGMDAIEIGDVLATYIEATTKGYTNGDGGLEEGNYMDMIAMIEKVIVREGIGNVLADGVDAVAAHFGHSEIAMSCKGQGIPAYDPRGIKGMGIAYATSNRGACHLRAYTPAVELSLIPLTADPLEWKGKGDVTKLLQDLHAFSDSLDLCKFSAFAEGAEEYANQYAAMLGLESFTVDDVLETGERIYNLERYYNNLAGFGAGSDKLPARFLEEPSTMPGSEGHVCELDLMLEEYYAGREWEDGVVPEAKLKALAII